MGSVKLSEKDEREGTRTRPSRHKAASHGLDTKRAKRKPLGSER